MSTPLPSPRQEQFAQGLAAGLSRSAAYRKAYARPQGSSARACAARLSTKAHILQRVQEIRNEASPLATACLSALISSLEARARAEIDSGRLRSAVGLMERIAKVAGGVGWSTKVGMPLSDSEMGRDASDTLPGRVSGLNGSLAVRTAPLAFLDHITRLALSTLELREKPNRHPCPPAREASACRSIRFWPSVAVSSRRRLPALGTRMSGLDPRKL